MTFVGNRPKASETATRGQGADARRAGVENFGSKAHEAGQGSARLRGVVSLCRSAEIDDRQMLAFSVHP